MNNEEMECALCGKCDHMDNFVYRPDLVFDNPEEYQDSDGDYVNVDGCLYPDCDICTDCEQGK